MDSVPAVFHKGPDIEVVVFAGVLQDIDPVVIPDMLQRLIFFKPMR